ncbi:hypothetical protein F0562_025797 [Nyssa sinensis]|uniref:GIR1-like zinc ribbon domain-containing protein n=1 Tax=Nyssa sinensis TaxID=561372 RepID=A0A5J5B7A5_9ASTE|nr:hypothetical protein F0562_025797 [Nyssa sinensis]
MASNSKKHQVSQECSGGGKTPKSDTFGGDFDGLISLNIDHTLGALPPIDLHHEHLSNKLDYSSDHPFGMKNGFDHQIETRCLMEVEMDYNGEKSNMNLSLLGVETEDESFNESVSSSSTPSKRSCMSMEHSSASDSSPYKIDTADVPSLILMGCTRCYMYVVVSEIDPICPECKSNLLLDIFR